MRIHLVMRCKPGTLLPFNYNYFINGMILDKIKFADSEYAQELHDGTSFKFFTFSELLSPRMRLDKERNGLLILSDTVELLVSSPRERFVKAFLSGILSKPEIYIGSVVVELESASVLERPTFSNGKAIFKTLTPIVTSTKREIDGKLKTWDLMPQDMQFYNNIRNNLVEKYREFNGENMQSDTFNIRVIKPLRTKRIKIKNEFHTGSMMVFEASGSQELLEFAYECGLGERNSMGFGMVEVAVTKNK